VEGLFVCTLMAGAMLVLLGATGMGSAVRFIPRPVIVGFTNGIAVLIASTQIRDFLGLQIERLPSDFPAPDETGRTTAPDVVAADDGPRSRESVVHPRRRSLVQANPGASSRWPRAPLSSSRSVCRWKRSAPGLEAFPPGCHLCTFRYSGSSCCRRCWCRR
jgi:hypothetical protein